MSETKTDLSLVPIEELIEEIKGRSDAIVLGYTRTIDPGAPIIIWQGNAKTSWMDMVALCEQIKFDIFYNRRVEDDEI